MSRPLTFLINTRSGGQAGTWLQKKLAARFPGRVHQIGEVDSVELCRGLAAESGALVACGGDGTASHALDAAWQAGSNTPIGIIPLGTGNDLSRSQGWGGHTPSDTQLDWHLALLATAPAKPIDRWILHGPMGSRVWFNYWSVGIDAQVALGFHQARERRPQWFCHPLFNKAVYGAIGLSQRPGRLAISSRADHRPPPPWAAGLIVTNIASWAGGVRLHARIRADDGHAEAFAIASGLPLGLVAGRLRRPFRLGTRTTWTFITRKSTAMQCDGEPFLAPPGEYRTHWTGRCQVLSTNRP